MTLDGAIRAGDLGGAEAAVRAGEDFERTDAGGLSPLMIAAGLGRYDMARLLLSAGANPNAIDPVMGATALHKAVQNGKPEVIGLLLDHGALVDQQSASLGNTPLIDAVLHKHEQAVVALLERGARTTIRNHWQQSALDLARADRLDDIARAIELHDAAKPEQVSEPALFAAIRAGDTAAVTQLIAAGADVNQHLPVTGQVEDDYIPLGIAVGQRQSEIVGLLLDAGADPSGEMGLMRGNAIHEASFHGHADVLRVLLARGQADRVVRALSAPGPYNGFTPLHDAAWHGHLEAARLLIDAGAPLTARNQAGQTPHDLARLYGYGELADVLAAAES